MWIAGESPMRIHQEVFRIAGGHLIGSQQIATLVLIEREIAKNYAGPNLISLSQIINSLALKISDVDYRRIVSRVQFIVEAAHQISNEAFSSREQIRATLVGERPIDYAGQSGERRLQTARGFHAIAVSGLNIKYSGRAIAVLRCKRAAHQRDLIYSVGINHRHRSAVGIASGDRMHKVFGQDSIEEQTDSIKGGATN